MQLKALINKKIEITEYESVTSTNIIAKQAAPLLQEDMLVICAHQSEGRGRLGRSFFSPFCGGIYMSLCLHTSLSAKKLPLITTAAAVAVAQTLEEAADKQFGIKWVNDIYLDNKKVCGILTEGVFDPVSGKPYCAVLGIGINLTAPVGGYPEKLKGIAGAVFEEECPKDKKNEIIAGIINRFYAFYDDIQSKSFLDDYRKRSTLDGKHIYYLKNGVKCEGEVVGIDDDFHLLVKDKNNNVHSLDSGEVTVGGANEAHN